ncbi:Bug family tripartite tricarboxylate transporter substrate binding protein [Cupriavidus consociatus]|uniref:Bug family tripartite tricarboxylate transporter substrate binding protein n=1 Tax=Cupriavidus consociatus TaxID=2821357 RepID=UPI001AEA8909|nr:MULTISPECIES: tripartite tricarboxylate transporter substrate binding protein [unclassified Cupriavidus]MBP0620690.1 tripartite tricarboxylate transporter substrate binding protein [Cupriavidus sp. LEh25]MDK2657350.1 tripartite tricarboxylate transporter substrate binding protein [Cupriavidus sp. LEh21]
MRTTLFRRARHALAGITTLAVLGGLPGAVNAQETRPVRLIVPTQPGSQADAVARALSQPLGKHLGQSVVVENVAGAGGVPGTQQIVRAPKDGSTLGLISSNHVINPFIYKNLPYDSLKDITPITVIGTLPLVLVVNPSVNAQSTRELVALLKSKPGELNYGSSGNGTVLHLAGQLFASEAKVDIRHVPYKGAGNYTTDLVGGQVQVGFLTVQAVLPLLKAGKLKAIAVSTAQRVPALPEVPTLAESGLPRYSFDAWLAIVGPAGLSKSNVSALQSRIQATLQERDVQEHLAGQGVVVAATGADAAVPFFRSELDKHARIVKQAGATLN